MVCPSTDSAQPFRHPVSLLVAAPSATPETSITISLPACGHARGKNKISVAAHTKAIKYRVRRLRFLMQSVFRPLPRAGFQVRLQPPYPFAINIPLPHRIRRTMPAHRVREELRLYAVVL